MNARNAQLGGQIAVLIFIVTLLAFVTETQFTQVLAILPPPPPSIYALLSSIQYVQTSLGFRQPYFLLYVFATKITVILSAELL